MGSLRPSLGTAAAGGLAKWGPWLARLRAHCHLSRPCDPFDSPVSSLQTSEVLAATLAPVALGSGTGPPLALRLLWLRALRLYNELYREVREGTLKHVDACGLGITWRQAYACMRSCVRVVFMLLGPCSACGIVCAWSNISHAGMPAGPGVGVQ